MHFHSLVVIDLPEITPNHEKEALTAKAIAELEQRKAVEPNNFMLDIYINRLRGVSSTFSAAVDAEVEKTMEPYGCESTNFYEFMDMSEDLEDSYQNNTLPSARFPDGSIVGIYDHVFRERFQIRENIVFESCSGKLKQPKRTHIAKKMKYLPDFPVNRLYPDIETYAKDYFCYEYSEEEEAFGYYTNPNAMWDWYQIGGRWPVTFLVKSDCGDYSIGERDHGDDDSKYPAPEGYRWVSAARKKDIQWQAMKDFKLEQEKSAYQRLNAMFVHKTQSPGPYMTTRDGCVYQFTDLIYRIGESEEDYLERCGLGSDVKYPVSFCDLVTRNEWIQEGSLQERFDGGEQHIQTWARTIESYIDALEDDQILASVDYHM